MYNFGRVCMSVCLYVCQPRTFKSFDVGSSYLHMQHISMVYGLSSYMKVTGSRSRSLEGKKVKKFLFPQCKTSIGNNSSSIKHEAVMFVCCMGFLGTADRCCNRRLSHVTGSEHA